MCSAVQLGAIQQALYPCMQSRRCIPVSPCTQALHPRVPVHPGAAPPCPRAPRRCMPPCIPPAGTASPTLTARILRATLLLRLWYSTDEELLV
jgi:hypothetical protein